MRCKDIKNILYIVLKIARNNIKLLKKNKIYCRVDTNQKNFKITT